MSIYYRSWCSLLYVEDFTTEHIYDCPHFWWLQLLNALNNPHNIQGLNILNFIMSNVLLLHLNLTILGVITLILSLSYYFWNISSKYWNFWHHSLFPFFICSNNLPLSLGSYLHWPVLVFPSNIILKSLIFSVLISASVVCYYDNDFNSIIQFLSFFFFHRQCVSFCHPGWSSVDGMQLLDGMQL